MGHGFRKVTLGSLQIALFLSVFTREDIKKNYQFRVTPHLILSIFIEFKLYHSPCANKLSPLFGGFSLQGLSPVLLPECLGVVNCAPSQPPISWSIKGEGMPLA